ncbi:MAG: hypothetical protein ACR2GA_02625, partial [Chloroflexota bacterium]
IWAVVVSPLLALYLQNAGPALREQFPSLSYRRRPVEGRIGPILHLALVLLIGFAYITVGARFVNASALREVEAQNFPRVEVAYMREHALPPRVFVSYSWGGYMLWNLFPRYRDYMDSRADTLFNDRILRDYLTMYYAKPRWDATLRHYGIQDVLVERTAPLAQVLAQDSAWRLASHDKLGVVYVRK